MMPLLELKSIHRSYPSGEQSVEVLKDRASTLFYDVY